MIRRQRRCGVTLMEVLITLGILALGILALMSMFPLAAYQMAQSVKDDRCATLAANSDAMAQIMWRTAWESPLLPGGIDSNEMGPNGVFSREHGLAYLDNNGVTSVATTSYGPSNPVYFDPIGVVSNSVPNLQQWVAGYKGYLVRSPISAAPNLPTAIRLCSILDDMTFFQTGALAGTPDTSNIYIDRGGQFSVAWLLQRRKNNVRSEANVTVVIYSKRSPVNASLEYPFTGIVNNGTTAVQLNLAGTAPIFKKGSWILDISQLPTASGQIDYRADFYRIVGYTASGSLELQNPVKTNALYNIYPSGNSQYPGTFIVMDNVVEVFDRGTVSAIGSPAQ